MEKFELHTEEFKTAVAKMWNDGYSAGYIGKRVGENRNVIIGVVHRLREKGVNMREGITITPHSRKSGDRRKGVPSMPIIPGPKSKEPTP